MGQVTFASQLQDPHPLLSFRNLELYLENINNIFEMNNHYIVEEFGCSNISAEIYLQGQSHKLAKAIKKIFFKKFINHVYISLTYNENNNEEYIRIKKIKVQEFVEIMNDFEVLINNKQTLGQDKKFINKLNLEETKDCNQIEIEDDPIFLKNSQKPTTIFSKEFIQTPGLDDNEGHECPICLTKVSDTVLPCLHNFCSQCIADWMIRDQTCPMCRLQKNSDNFMLLQASATQDEINESISNKISQMLSE